MLWSEEIIIYAVCAPTKAALSPTSEALVENVKPAHLQACVRKHALDPGPPNIEPTDYGWVKMEANKTLVQCELHVASTTTVAPE